VHSIGHSGRRPSRAALPHGRPDGQLIPPDDVLAACQGCPALRPADPGGPVRTWGTSSSPPGSSTPGGRANTGVVRRTRGGSNTRGPLAGPGAPGPRRRPGRPCAAARGELAPRAETPRGPYEGGVRCREAGKAATVGHGYPPTGNAAAVGSSDATHGPATTAAAKRARSITSSPATTTTKRTSQRSARRVIVARAPLKASQLVRRCVRVRVDRPSRTRACCGHARARGGGGPPPARTR